MKSVMADNNGRYLDENSLDFSVSNKALSDKAYQIGELGAFEYSDVNNRGINSEDSVSWTSGSNWNGEDMYSFSDEDRNEIDAYRIDDDSEWKHFNEINGSLSSLSSFSSNSSSSQYGSEVNSEDDSYWTSDENTLEENSSSFSSYSSDSLSSDTSECSSCSESYQNSALRENFYKRPRRDRRNNFEPHEPVEPAGVWRYQNGQLVTLENMDNIDDYFLNLTQEEYDNFGFPGFHGRNTKYRHHKTAEAGLPKVVPDEQL